MALTSKLRPKDLERRELQSTIFACSAIAIMSIGTALLMYPLAFSRQNQNEPGERMLHIAFFGFCGLSLLLAAYLWERQRTISKLRREAAADRVRIVETQWQASAELLKTMPNLGAFQDRLPMEYRRALSTTHKLSVLLVMLELPPGASASENTILLGDAAKTISRRLRQQDSLYMLGPSFFAVVLPDTDITIAQSFSSRVSEGLSDAAGAASRFSYAVRIVNYPAHASSAHELEHAVCSLIPTQNPQHVLAQALA